MKIWQMEQDNVQSHFPVGQNQMSVKISENHLVMFYDSAD